MSATSTVAHARPPTFLPCDLPARALLLSRRTSEVLGPCSLRSSRRQWLPLYVVASSPNTINGREDQPTPSSRIFIKGLPSLTVEGCLAKAFFKYGQIKRVKLLTSKTDEPLGMAYIWFDCEEEARLAVKEMDGKFMNGRFISVTLARPEASSKQVRTIAYKFNV